MARIGVRAIKLPKFDPRVIERAILKEKRDKGRDIVKNLEKTVANWSGEKPDFKAKVRDRGRDVVIEITLTGTDLAINKWRWLDEGTDPHDIPLSPKPGRSTLWFADTRGDPYRAGTKPGTFATTKSRVSSGQMHAPKQVKHPGIKARGWTELVRKMMEDEFGKRIRVVLREAVVKAQK